MINFLNTNIPDPVAFSIFGFDIMWYGILIAAAILTAVLLFLKRLPKHGIPAELGLDAVIICIPAGLVGTRLYYVAFNWSYYSDDILSIFNIRHGGLAVHGGLIAAFVAAYIFCRVKKVNALNGFDAAAPSVAIAQAIGRWGNYFNSEAHGGPTDLPWGILVSGELVHPTFLYESLLCLALFFFLVYTNNKRKFEGQTFISYCAIYSFGRFFIEGLRTDSLMLGILRQAQVLSAVVFAVCVLALVILGRKAKKTV